MPDSSKRPRRAFTAAFKTENFLCLLTGSKTQAELCREHELSPNLLAQWKDAFLQNAPAAFQSRDAGAGMRDAGKRDAQKGFEPVALEQRRALVKRLHEENPSWSVAALCSVLSVPRSSFYHRSQRHDEAPLVVPPSD